MLDDLKEKFSLSFFDKISLTNYWYWNEDKTIFTPLISNHDEFEDFILYWERNELDKNSSPWFYTRLILLKSIGVIKEITSHEYILIPNKYNNPTESKIAYEYKIKYDIEKLNFLKKIIHDNDSLELKVSRKLIDFLLFLERKYSQKENYNLFNITTIIEELNIKKDRYIFRNFTILLYSIATYNSELVRKLIKHLIIYLEKSDTSTLLITLENDEIITQKVFWYEKKNKNLYIHHISGDSFKIKTVELDSEYDLLWEELMIVWDWEILISKINIKYKTKITSLADLKKNIFKWLLANLFFNKSTKDRLKFNKIVFLETLLEKNILEKDVLEYLKSNFKLSEEVISKS